ncbi:MAG: sensor histidine kinase [Kiritimatiellae bacterium]|nr:sensor histidine kinase [Kiritimatiellia bacterium]
MKRKPMTLTVAFLSVLAFCSNGAETTRIIRDAAELTATMWEGNKDVPFDLTATVILPLRATQKLYAVKDETGTAILNKGDAKECALQPGDRIHVTGTCNFDAMCKTIAVLSHGDIPRPEEITATGITEGRYDNHFVRLIGTVRDAFRDEIDPLWGFLVLQSGHESVYACFPSSDPEKALLNNLIGAEIAIIGLCSTKITKPRLLSGRYIFFSERDAIAVLRPAPADPFDVPSLYETSHTHHSIVSGMDRRRVAGRVIAVWHGDRMLLRTPDQHIVRVDLADRNPPTYGTSIEAVGIPETDLYRVNLSRAIWRTNSIPEDAEAPPKDVTAKQLLTDWRGMSVVQTEYHGQAIRIKGLVRSLPSPEGTYSRMALECGKYIIPVDANACPRALDGIDIGCTIEVSGTCLIEIDNWRPNAPFPHVEGLALVVRTPTDVHVISHPPWWTSGRLLSVIGALMAVLIGVFAWNRSLNKLAERRGRELLREQIEHVKSDLKVEERTRLAVELHDSLAQSLTGVSMEIEAAKELKGNAPADMLSHLNFAARTLMSCRNELRNCLWDLRSQALEEKSMDKAIERTLLPYVNDSRIAVRFDMPRTRLSDNTAHMLLCIIRELVLNAIRHGNASSIHVTGVLDGGELKFSVQDNGSGFDPENYPGVLQGHFGLQGIHERVEQLGGTLNIESAAGSGTRVAISIKVPHQK